MNVTDWAKGSESKIQVLFNTAGLGEHTAGVNLVQASAALFRAVLRDDIPAGFVVVSAYMGLEHNPLFSVRPERYRTVLNEAIVALMLDPERNAHRCADVGMAVLFDLGGFAAVRLHGDGLKQVLQEII